MRIEIKDKKQFVNMFNQLYTENTLTNINETYYYKLNFSI